MALGKIIELDDQTRKLYSRYDFKYFLDLHFRTHQYSETDLQTLYASYQEEKLILKKQIKKDKRQALFHIEGIVRKCHADGFLPQHFNLDGSTDGGYLNFKDIGRTWAYFDIWSRAERRKNFRKNFWDIVVKTGALLGFILTVIKIIEIFRTPK